jgi:cytochrome c
MNSFYKFVPLTSLAFILVACGGESSSSATAPKPASETVQTASAPAKTSMTPVQRGERLYRRCIACHTLGQGEKHKVGPNLYGVFGQVAGAKEDFNYSKAMKASEIVWTEETLSAYIQRPNAYIPGNRMSFVGIKKEDDRAAIIAYMKVKTAPIE